MVRILTLWCSVGSSYLLRLIAGASAILMTMGGVDRSSSVPMIRCLMRSLRWLVPQAELRQYGVNGRLARLCLAGRKRSLMANFDNR
jgi:hypothetical protein